MNAAAPQDRYAVVTATISGPNVSFWTKHESVIGLLCIYAQSGCCTRDGVAVWHRKSAKARWVCISE